MKPLEPIRQALMIEADQQRTFDMFARNLPTWWPMAGRDADRRSGALQLEGRIGGRIYRVGPDGVEHEWGRVLSWHRPVTFSFVWGLVGPESAEVDLRFQRLGPALTRVVVEHRDWEILSSALFDGYLDYAGGWLSALRRFAALFEVDSPDDILSADGGGQHPAIPPVRPRVHPPADPETWTGRP